MYINLKSSFHHVNFSLSFYFFLHVFSAFDFSCFVVNPRILPVLCYLLSLGNSYCTKLAKLPQTLLSKRSFKTQKRSPFFKIQNNINRLKQLILTIFKVFRYAIENVKSEIINLKISFSNFLVQCVIRISGVLLSESEQCTTNLIVKFTSCKEYKLVFRLLFQHWRGEYNFS